jgi:hypothetical protein
VNYCFGFKKTLILGGALALLIGAPVTHAEQTASDTPAKRSFLQCVQGWLSHSSVRPESELNTPGVIPIAFSQSRKDSYLIDKINAAQARFLKKVGVKLSSTRVSALAPRSVALEINRQVDAAIQAGKIAASGSIPLRGRLVAERWFQ